jgi:hypothetical protein
MSTNPINARVLRKDSERAQLLRDAGLGFHDIRFVRDTFKLVRANDPVALVEHLTSTDMKPHIDLFKNRAGMTSLLKACERGYTGVARVLLEAKADPFIFTGNDEYQMEESQNRNALHLAAQNNHADTVELLIDHARAVYASDEDPERAMRKLLDCNTQSRHGERVGAVLLAAQEGNFPIVRLLLDAKADCNVSCQTETCCGGGSESSLLYWLGGRPKSHNCGGESSYKDERDNVTMQITVTRPPPPDSCESVGSLKMESLKTGASAKADVRIAMYGNLTAKLQAGPLGSYLRFARGCELLSCGFDVKTVDTTGWMHAMSSKKLAGHIEIYTHMVTKVDKCWGPIHSALGMQLMDEPLELAMAYLGLSLFPRVVNESIEGKEKQHALYPNMASAAYWYARTFKMPQLSACDNPGCTTLWAGADSVHKGPKSKYYCSSECEDEHTRTTTE